MKKNLVALIIIGWTLSLLPQATFAGKKSALPFIQVERIDKEILEASTVDEDYHTIDSIEIEEMDLDDVVVPYQSKLTGDSLGQIVMVIDKLIAIGKKVWQIIEAGKPVVQTDFTTIHVLPKGEDPEVAFYKMEGWDAPKVKSYTIRAKNKFKSDVVTFQFHMLYQPGGKLNGKGHYLTGVNVTPYNVEVAWGYSLDAKSSLMAISNRGTAEDPVAGATITMVYKIKTMLKEATSSATFHVTGLGELTKL